MGNLVREMYGQPQEDTTLDCTCAFPRNSSTYLCESAAATHNKFSGHGSFSLSISFAISYCWQKLVVVAENHGQHASS